MLGHSPNSYKHCYNGNVSTAVESINVLQGLYECMALYACVMYG